MSAPIFVELDGAVLLAQNIATYESITGRTVQPAQVEMLLINAFTEIQLRTLFQIQSACQQMLVAYASAPALDELGKLVGVTRLPATGALATVRLTIVSGHGGILIPSGMRIQTTDGKVVFEVVSSTEVLVGETQKDVQVIAQTSGTIGNGYTTGAISVILDPQPYLLSASNITVSESGSDAETDDELRDRIVIAPAQFSVAGPKDAYKFFAKSASPAIIDVAVAQLSPGTVGVYPLVSGGSTPPEIITLVEVALNDEKVRPLTDTVVVEAPTVISYDIEVEVETNENVDTGAIQDAIEAALDLYAGGKAVQMGKDIVLSQIIAAASVDGVYKVTVIAPGADIVVAFNEVPIIGTRTVTITGENEG